MDEDEILNARQVAEQNPELDATRRQLFGENYLQDIDQGTGIAQYYTGFGEMPTLNYTPAAAVDTSTPAVDVTQPIVDTGGGGGVGVQGAIGDPVVAPGEMPVTQEEMDAFNQIPVNREYGDLMNIGYGEGQVDPGLAAAVGGVDTTPVEVNEDLIDRGNPLNDPRIQPEEFGLVGTPEYIDPIMDPNLMNIRQQQAIDFQTPEQTNAINEAFNSVKNLGEAGVGKLRDSLVALGGKVKEGFDNTIEIGGKTIDLGKSLLGGAISLATGIPGIGFALNALGELKTDPADTLNRKIVDELKSENDYGYNMSSGTLNQDPFGRNPVSAFGDYEQTLLDDINSGSNTKMGLAKTEFAQDYFNKKSAATAPQEDISAISGDMNTGADSVSGDLPDGGNIGDEFGSGGDTQATIGPTVSRSDTDYGQFGRAQSAQAGGGGNQGGGGKIVCTMMNDSYGFGSFRNKIWLKHSRNMKPEYQIGYHKIFLPLVKLSKTNKVVKKVLEHIAVHRTIDIRQEARGKVHLLGRVYRKILEPICYIVGKHAKR